MNLKRQSVFILLVISFVTIVNATDFNFEDTTGGENNERIKAIAGRVTKARDTLSKVSTGINALAKMAKNPYNLLTKFQKILGVLGPVAMGVSIVLSIVCAFLPQPDSKELAFMKEKFDVVIGGMLRIESKLSDLENTVIHEVTKAGYGEYQRTIVGLYEDWKDTINSQNTTNESVSRAFFIQQYRIQYKHAAFHLFNAMIGYYDGELNNDLLGTAKARYKCNGLKIRKLCSTVTRIIMQGVALEGAYFSYVENFAKADESETVWAQRMKLMEKKCDEVVTECRVNWKEYAVPVLNQTYEQYKRASNNELSSRLFTELSNALPQKAWFVFVYNEVTGFEYHAFTTYHKDINEDAFKKWRENEKMLTVHSFDMDNYPEFYSRAETANHLENIRDIARRCTTSYSGPPVENRPSMVYNKYVFENLGLGGIVAYSIRSDLNLAFYGTDERYVRVKMDVPARCPRQNEFLFDVFSLG